METGVGLPIEPLAYHVEIIHYLQNKEPDLWKWFSADRVRVATISIL